MSSHGICTNLTFPTSRPSVSEVKTLAPARQRSITYWRDDQSSWRATLAAMRDYRDLGVYNLILFNTEASGTAFKSFDARAERLRQFLQLATDEFGSPVHGLETDNEIDTSGWTLGDGDTRPITAQWMLDSARNLADVCRQFTGRRWDPDRGVWAINAVECIGPSFLGGPATDAFTFVCAGMARHGRFAGCAQHYYGKAANGQPYPGFLFGELSDAVNESWRVSSGLPIHCTEIGYWSRAGGIGEAAQAAAVREICAFNAEHLAALYLFDWSDEMTPDGEYNAGKDWGLRDRGGRKKQGWAEYHGGLVLADHQATPTPEFVLGFRDMAALEPATFGTPLEAEYGPWNKTSQQHTSTGWFNWANVDGDGSRLWFDHDDGRRIRWQPGWPTYQVVGYGARNKVAA